MRPTGDTARSRPDLGQAMYETLQQSPTMGFIGHRVMPPFFVPDQSAEFPVIPVEALHEIRDDKRQSGGAYNRDDWEFEMGFYATRERGLEARKDAREMALYSDLFDYELVVSTRKYNQILRAAENRIAAKVMNVTNFPSPITATAAWGGAGSDPKKDVNNAMRALHDAGVDANTIVFSWNTFMKLTEDPAVQSVVYQLFPDAAKNGTISIAHLETYFGLQVLVGGALKNTAGPGVDASLAGIWSDTYAWVGRVSDSPDITEPCVGRTFVWNEGAEELVLVEDYPDNPTRSDIIRVRWDVDERLIASYDENGALKSRVYQRCGKLISGI